MIAFSQQLANGQQIDELAEFLALPEFRQFWRVEIISIKKLTRLRDDYESWAEMHQDGPLSLRVYAKILERCEPCEYNGDDACFFDSKLAEARENLTSEALKRLRADSYENRVRSQLHSEKQAEFVDSLDADDLKDWVELLNRYSRQYGRSRRCRDLESLLKEKIHDRSEFAADDISSAADGASGKTFSNP